VVAGTQTAGLGFGGYSPALAKVLNNTQEYDGSTWTDGGNLGNARYRLAGAGIQTAASAFAGDELHLVQQQQKNMTDLLGQLVEM
jgi:hypothetical protein